MEKVDSRFVDLVNRKCRPLVFKHAVIDWSEKWTLDSISKLLGDKQIKCKISVIQSEEFQWETECLHVEITMTQYIDWLHDRVNTDNPLRLFDRNKFSCYIDYKYMKELFQDHPDVLKYVSWGNFGLDDRDGNDSTIWIGSHGAYTPCHQDTYGFNLVAQLHGRKRWYMFDPSQTEYMYPTRIPYEESSIYSEVNIRYPDLNKHPRFQKSTPYIVDLEPGDVLYVPRHWWHFVECLESTITINTWVPLDADRQSRLDESCSRLLFSSLLSTLGSVIDRKQFLNTGEELHESAVNIQYLQKATQDLIDNKLSSSDKCDLTYSDYDSKNEISDHTVDNFNKFVNTFKEELVTVGEMPLVRLATDKQLMCYDCGKIFCTDNVKKNKTDFVNNRKRKLDSSDIMESFNETYNTSEKVSDIKSRSNRIDIPSKSVHSCKDRITDKDCIRIHAVPSMCFEDYVQFLEDKFDYERTTESNKVSDVDLCESDDLNQQKSKITLHDIFNAILEPSVISHISSVLMNRIKK
ncbi:Cupin superfamily protein [Mactra antiquata]